MRTNPPAPFDLPLDHFLAGRDKRNLEIDPIFGHEFCGIVSNYRPEELCHGHIVPAILRPGCKFREVQTSTDYGIVLLSPCDEIVGAYIGCALAIALEYRGRGLGAELIFEFAFTFGVLPAWYLDVPAYTPAGHRAHVRAWHMARNQPFLQKKQEAGMPGWSQWGNEDVEKNSMSNVAHRKGHVDPQLRLLESPRGYGRK